MEDGRRKNETRASREQDELIRLHSETNVPIWSLPAPLRIVHLIHQHHCHSLLRGLNDFLRV